MYKDGLLFDSDQVQYIKYCFYDDFFTMLTYAQLERAVLTL